MENCEIPTELMCPICRTILKNAVQLPCCSTSACRTCALKKLMVNKFKNKKYIKAFCILRLLRSHVGCGLLILVEMLSPLISSLLLMTLEDWWRISKEGEHYTRKLSRRLRESPILLMARRWADRLNALRPQLPLLTTPAPQDLSKN